MYRSLFLTVLFFVPSINAMILGIKKEFVVSSHELGQINLFHSEGNFYVGHEGKIHRIENHNVDKWFRPVKAEQLNQVLQHTYLYIVRASDGQFILHAFVKGLGGGAGGATAGFVVGKAAVYVVGWGSIAVVSAGVAMINPWAGKSTFGALSKLLAGPIEVASNKVGLAVGLAAGAATGPV